MPIQLKDNGQSAYENRLRDAWKKPVCMDADDTDCIVQDGARMTVPLMMMDSCQCAGSGSSAAVQDRSNAQANQNQLAAVKTHDRDVQKWADYYSGIRDGREHLQQLTDNGQSEYEARLADAWKNPANAIGG